MMTIAEHQELANLLKVVKKTLQGMDCNISFTAQTTLNNFRGAMTEILALSYKPGARLDLKMYYEKMEGE